MQRRIVAGLVAGFLIVGAAAPARAFVPDFTVVAKLVIVIKRLRDQIAIARQAAKGEIAAWKQTFRDLTTPGTDLVRDASDLVRNAPAGGKAAATAFRAFGGTADPFREQWRGRLAGVTPLTADALGRALNAAGLPPAVAADELRRFTRAEAAVAARTAGGRMVERTARTLADNVATAVQATAAIRANSNLSRTALQQAQVSNGVTQVETLIGMAQLQMAQAAVDAWEEEHAMAQRTVRQAAWRADWERRNADHATRLTGITDQRARHRALTRLELPALYGGNGYPAPVAP